MQSSSAFQYLAIDTIHESATNPRRTFEESKLQELAESIRHHGLIQPVTVRPNSDGFELIAGARRYRAAQLAELFSIPARIVEIDGAQALKWQLVENALRADIHPYEEAQGFQRLLDMPGYDVTALVEKSGKSASHIYARLSLLQLIPAVAEAFTQERITASHANLADAPFDREDPTLNPAAGACVTCPRRSGYNTVLFADVVSDQCLDGPCFQTKITAHIDRELAARPELVQIENGWRHAREQRPGAVQRGHFREIESIAENPDAEPVAICAAVKPAIIVYGKRLGTTLTVCTDNNCPVHDPRAAARLAQDPAPTMATAPEQETEEEALERKQSYEQQQSEYAQMQERRAEERRQEEERREQEYEAEQVRREELRQTRKATFERILVNAPDTFSAAQLRMLLRALVNLDPYTFPDDVAEEMGGQTRTTSVPPRRFCWRRSTRLETRSCPSLPCVSPSHRTSPFRVRGRWTLWQRPKLSSYNRNRRRPVSQLQSRPGRLQRKRRPQPKPAAGVRSPAPVPFPLRRRSCSSSRTDSRSPRGSRPDASGTLATTRSGMEGAASKADVPPASPCSTSITQGSRLKLLTATSSGRPRPGHRFVSSEPNRLRSMRNTGSRPAQGRLKQGRAASLPCTPPASERHLTGDSMDRTESIVRNMLGAIEAQLYDVGVLSDRGMLPGLDGIPASAVLERLPLLKYRNARGSHIYIRPSGEHRFTVLDDLDEASLARLPQTASAPAPWSKPAPAISRPGSDTPLSSRSFSAPSPPRLWQLDTVPTRVQRTGGDSDGFPALPTANRNTANRLDSSLSYG